MADQTDPNYQTPVYPQSSWPDQSTVVTQEVYQVPPTEVPVYEPPTVVVSNQNGVPKWFYFLFGITLTIFFIVTALLVVNYTQKKSIFQLLGIGQETSTPLPVVTLLPSPVVTKELLPSVVPTSPATSAGDLKLPQLSASDEVSDLEKDVADTDFAQLEKALSNLDREMGAVGVNP